MRVWVSVAHTTVKPVLFNFTTEVHQIGNFPIEIAMVQTVESAAIFIDCALFLCNQVFERQGGRLRFSQRVAYSVLLNDLLASRTLIFAGLLMVVHETGLALGH